MPNSTESRMDSAIERLSKWRDLLAGWQLGKRDESDTESQAVRDHREVTLILRAEVNSLLRMCIEKGQFDESEFQTALAEEADLLSKVYERRFPGFRATDRGLEVDTKIAADTTRGWWS